MDQRALTSGGKEYLPQAIELLGGVFKEDPVITYLLNSLSPGPRLAYIPSYFQALLTAATLNKGIITEISDWKCCGVLIPPGEKVDNPRTWLKSGVIPFMWNLGLSGSRKTLFEYTPMSDKAKAKEIKSREKYYYVFFLGTRADSQGHGLASDIIRHYQDLAAKAKLPLWLEATTSYSRDLYLKLGFKTVEEMVLGSGVAAANGTQLQGGEGVKVWGMLWRPSS